jgi:hypothetical protein
MPDLPSQLSQAINKAANTRLSGRTNYLNTFDQLVHDIADVLARHFPSFDRARFIAACDVPENGE